MQAKRDEELLVRYSQERFVNVWTGGLGGGLSPAQCVCHATFCVGELTRLFCTGLYKQVPLLSLFYSLPRKTKSVAPNCLGDAENQTDVHIDMLYVETAHRELYSG